MISGISFKAGIVEGSYIHHSGNGAQHNNHNSAPQAELFVKAPIQSVIFITDPNKFSREAAQITKVAELKVII